MVMADGCETDLAGHMEWWIVALAVLVVTVCCGLTEFDGSHVFTLADVFVCGSVCRSQFPFQKNI